jgi:hypothetical protein
VEALATAFKDLDVWEEHTADHSCPRQENQFELSKKQSPPIIVPAPDRL